MNGWVIVIRPGGDLYQILDTSLQQPTVRNRLLRFTLKTIFAGSQLYFWLKRVGVT